MWLTGLVAPRHVGSSQTRARTRVPCIGRQILNHCSTREALGRQKKGARRGLEPARPLHSALGPCLSRKVLCSSWGPSAPTCSSHLSAQRVTQTSCGLIGKTEDYPAVQLAFLSLPACQASKQTNQKPATQALPREGGVFPYPCVHLISALSSLRLERSCCTAYFLLTSLSADLLQNPGPQERPACTQPIPGQGDEGEEGEAGRGGLCVVCARGRRGPSQRGRRLMRGRGWPRAPGSQAAREGEEPSVNTS